MSESEAEVLSNSQSIEERDREFFESLRVPSVTKETIINLSFDRIKEIRSQVSQLNLTVSDLRQSLGRTVRTADKSSVTLDQLLTQLRLSNESIEDLKTELAVERSKAMPSDSQPTGVNLLSSSESRNPQPTATLNLEKPNIKLAQPEPFSGEKVRLINDWLAAVRRYLMLSGVEETKWVAYTTTMLTSTALSWWNSVELSNPGKSIRDYSWIEFVNLVRERFVPVDSEAVAMSKMSQWKQTSSVAVYVSQFQSFNQLISKERLDEEMRVQMFIQGLKPESKSIINMWEPKTLQQVYKMAQKFDNSQRQSHPKFSQHTSTRINRTRVIEQQEGTRNNPITFNNTQLQTETQLAVSEEGDGEDDLNQMNGQNGQRGVCHYCKSPGHYLNVCPKLRLKCQFESESHPTSTRGRQSSTSSKN